MYYYFDGKEDLYAHVVRVEFQRFFAESDPSRCRTTRDPDVFWSTVQAYYLRQPTTLAARPQLAALIRGWLAASDNPALRQAQTEMEQDVLPWIERVLAAGQRVGAIRTDLPSGC